MDKVIASFRRSGYNLLAQLLHRNLETGCSNYEQLHYSHSSVPVRPFICVHRGILPTMLSYYRMRERFGIGECSFYCFLRERADLLPKATGCAVLYNGSLRTEAHYPKYDARPLPQVWLDFTSEARASAKLQFSYQQVVENPYGVCKKVALAFNVQPRIGEFVPVLNRVGWIPVEEQPVAVSSADYKLLAQYEEQLCERL